MFPKACRLPDIANHTQNEAKITPSSQRKRARARERERDKESGRERKKRRKSKYVRRESRTHRASGEPKMLPPAPFFLAARSTSTAPECVVDSKAFRVKRRNLRAQALPADNEKKRPQREASPAGAYLQGRRRKGFSVHLLGFKPLGFTPHRQTDPPPSRLETQKKQNTKACALPPSQSIQSCRLKSLLRTANIPRLRLLRSAEEKDKAPPSVVLHAGRSTQAALQALATF